MGTTASPVIDASDMKILALCVHGGLCQFARRPLLFKSFTGLEIREFDIISREIESKYYEHERKRLSNGKRKRDVGAGRPFNLKLRERFLMF